MKNIDKILAMSAEELYEFDKEGMCHKCIYHRQDGCDNTEPIATKSYHNVCKKGYILWLNQERNPMPVFQSGDIIINKGKNLLIFCGYPEGYAKTVDGVYKVRDLDKNYVGKVYRYNTQANEMEEIWRADNEPHKWQDKQE